MSERSKFSALDVTYWNPEKKRIFFDVFDIVKTKARIKEIIKLKNDAKKKKKKKKKKKQRKKRGKKRKKINMNENDNEIT